MVVLETLLSSSSLEMEFYNAMNGNLESYKKIFGIEHVAVNKVGFEVLRFIKHDNPKFLLFDNPGIDLGTYFAYVRDPIMELTDKELMEEVIPQREIDMIRAEERQLDSLYNLTCTL